MAREKRLYVCSDCGAEASQWAGQCVACGAWNSLSETRAPTPATSSRPGRFAGYAGAAENRIVSLGSIKGVEQTRTHTGIDELDRVLGGGLVSGSVVLIGGDPGIGKSTLLLQAVAHLQGQLKTLYVSGEESLEQIALRARRVELGAEQIDALSETCVERIIGQAQTARPDVLVIDSIQTIYSDELSSAPGSVAQVRETAARLVRFAKQSGITVIMIGHVTKEGTLAGPRVLEHMVDSVLYIESAGDDRFRMLRAVKNRFGAVNELGVFVMDDRGLREVSNPSAIFLSRDESDAPGSVVTITWEGTRPLLVEVQALVDDSPLSNPRRVTVGLEQNRLALLLAVLHRHAGLAMFDQDVYANVVGGVRVTETAADLALVAAALSSFRNQALSRELVVFGELGLAGEVRPVPNGQERLREAAKHGFKRAVVAQSNAPKKPIHGISVQGVRRIGEAIDALLA